MLKRPSLALLAKRGGMWLVGLFLILVFYGIGKVGAALGDPALVPMTALDRAVPFVPWTVWVYSTITWVSLFAFITLPERSDALRMLAAIGISSAICALFFVTIPTTFPRDLFPLGELNTTSALELARLRDSDSPTNCFPSLHVALAWGIALSWMAGMHNKGLGLLALLWATLVSFATLTTKQHYVLDLPSGAVVGVFAWWASRRLLRGDSPTPIWHPRPELVLHRPAHQAAITRLLSKVEGHQWSLDEVDWPAGPLPPLDPLLVRLINELIYVEEIAGRNFEILARAAKSDELTALYDYFADEERRHADGLRKVLELHCAKIRHPGLGNSLVLDEFEALDASSDADVLLIATSNSVFETMLDAGTVPFLRTHPALQSVWFDDFVKRITRDESAHLAVNWMVIREAGERYRGLRGLRLLLNPSILRGMVAVPFMSLDVYSLAHRMGYRFETLLPAFGKLWRLHRRYPELHLFPLWWVFRLFTLAGVVATLVAGTLARLGLLLPRFWTTFTAGTDLLARLSFHKHLLKDCRLPQPGPYAVHVQTQPISDVVSARS